MSPELDKRIPGAPHPAVLSRHFPAAVEHREAHSSGRGSAHRQLLRSDAGTTGIVCFGHCRIYPVACAPIRISPDGQLRPLAARAHRDRARELAAAIRPMGSGQGRQSPVDLDVANVGGFAAQFLMREWDAWTVDGWNQSRSAPSARQATSLQSWETRCTCDPYSPSDITGATLWLL